MCVLYYFLELYNESFLVLVLIILLNQYISLEQTLFSQVTVTRSPSLYSQISQVTRPDPVDPVFFTTPIWLLGSAREDSAF
jgi:hypothetical protein